MAALIHFALDPFSRRMRLALAEYGAGVELIAEEPWAPSSDIYALNPAGTLPVYMEDSQTVICGVEAIGEYLEETLASRVKLIPGDAKARAEVRRLAGWFDSKFYAEVTEPLLSEKALRRFVPAGQGGGAIDMGRVRQAIAALPPHLDAIAELSDRRTWLAGPTLSLADLAAAAHLSVAEYFGDIPWADYPVAKSWYQRVKSRPSFRPLLADTLRGVPPAPGYTSLDF